MRPGARESTGRAAAGACRLLVLDLQAAGARLCRRSERRRGSGERGRTVVDLQGAVRAAELHFYASTDTTLRANTALKRIPGCLICVVTVETTSSAVNSTPSLQKMPLRSFTVISVKSALYCGLLAASELSQTPSRPRSGSMYQSVSRATCCSPFDCDPALMAQMLNHPAFLTVPSGFSRTSSSFRGIFFEVP